MICIDDYIGSFSTYFQQEDKEPWEIVNTLPEIINHLITQLGNDFIITNGAAIHKTATVEAGAVLKPPVIVGANCFIGANAYLRGGVFLGNGVKIGPGCEIKSSIIFNTTSLAHFNFIGDSIIGSNVNFEAGAVTANHYNERADKQIEVLYKGEIIKTNTQKFGALVGDGCKIGANAVLSPGTLLAKNTIVKRLELVEQVISFLQ
jgi:UDP-N-acetylglucosamine diphosphorylase / glucose-1-phosphate thymidylyltransferase / UDP-N-acetylgalactosamine diphosphorylase / glucosamine-1-phosphate N-acetyltransferase / galactosamine-1-phosphate N-acetyltransferase